MVCSISVIILKSIFRKIDLRYHDKEQTTMFPPSRAYEQPPRMLDYVAALLPTLIILCSSIVILIFSYYAKGNQLMEHLAPTVSSILSGEMFFLEIIIILYPHHERFDIVPLVFSIVARFNFVHLAFVAAFISYVSTTNDYGTYLTWVTVLTIPIIMLTIIPFAMGVFTRPLQDLYPEQQLALLP
jgi:hypothetical protein